MPRHCAKRNPLREQTTISACIRSFDHDDNRSQKKSEKCCQDGCTLAKEAEIIAGIGRIIGSTLNIDEVYERFADEAKKLIPFDRVAINLINQEIERSQHPMNPD